MKRILNLTVDESGDFGSYEKHSPYYLIAMIFHDTKNDIDTAVQLLDTQVANLGFEAHAIHTGPLIRREGIYKNLSIDERKKLLNALVHFNRRVDVSYAVISAEKKKLNDVIDLTSRLSKQIKAFTQKHRLFFQQYDEINVYYDNGQIELTKLLTSTLSVLLPNISFHRAMPSENKLFQLVDMYCSLELVAIKFDAKISSNSELEFFHNYRTFKKDYLKKMRYKRIL
jgi:hypothetical protein